MEAAMKCGTADKFVETMGSSAYYGGLAEGFVDVSPLSENCAANTQTAIDAVKKMMVDGEWDVFTGVKLHIAADGTVTKSDAALKDNAGNEIVAAGGASVEDGVITGSMNYYVEGVQEA
jgi:basic membrane protein A